jgi:hypothetical protein
MANKEHLKIIEQGDTTWNEWRQENPHLRPSLNGAKLRCADLREINLRGGS